MFVGAFIPNWLLCRPEVSGGAKLAYARLCQFSGRDGLCFPKQSTLAAELGVAERTIRNHLRELEEFQLIEVDQPGLRQSNRYAFLAHSWMADAPGPESGHLERQTASGPDRQASAAPDRQVAAGPIGEENQEEENQKTHTPVGPSRPSSLAEVEACASMHGVNPEAARVFFHEAESNGWLNKHGQPIHKWQAALQAYGEKWRAVDYQRANASPARSRPRPRSGAFAIIHASDYSSTEI